MTAKCFGGGRRAGRKCFCKVLLPFAGSVRQSSNHATIACNELILNQCIKASTIANSTRLQDDELIMSCMTAKQLARTSEGRCKEIMAFACSSTHVIWCSTMRSAPHSSLHYKAVGPMHGLRQLPPNSPSFPTAACKLTSANCIPCPILTAAPGCPTHP